MRVAKKDYDESYDGDMNYNIRVGDYVETVDGDIGYVTDFIGEVDIVDGIITYGPNKGKTFRGPMYLAPKRFKRIGQYTFNQDKPKKPKKIELLDSTQEPVFKFNGKNCKPQRYDGERWGNLVYCNQIIDKINEIITYINDRED